MIIYIDIDETICITPEDRNYVNSTPIVERIAHFNKLYDEGNQIVYWTARGTLTGIDWTKVTEKQFDNWGVKYHKLMLKKPHYDMFICDKAINSETYFSNEKHKCIKK